MSRRKDHHHKDVLLGVALGAAVTGIVGGVVGWMFGKNDDQRVAEAVAVEHARDEVAEDRVSIKVVPPCELFLFKNEQRFSNESGRFTVSANSIQSVTHWSASRPCQLQCQRRSGEWMVLDTLQAASQIRVLRIPIKKLGNKLVDIVCFPPSNYTPDVSSSGSCTICLHNAADVQLIGPTPDACGHLALCWECLRELRNPECPICRCEVSAVSYNYRSS